jgi:hypothetical protein
MPKEAKLAPDLSTLAERAADAVLEASQARLLVPSEATEDIGQSYDDLLVAAGVNFDDDEDRAFGYRLPSDELRQEFERVLEGRHKCEYARERAMYLLGIALGKRLARLDGGAR